VADRLSPSDLADLIARYRAGNTVRDLAERFNLGTTTVKRLLREHKARRKDQRTESA
jgi:Mor family transcriptional regulator